MASGIFRRLSDSLADECLDTEPELSTAPLAHAGEKPLSRQLSSIGEFFSSGRTEATAPGHKHDRIMRFAPKGEKPIAEQVETLFSHERKCYEEIKAGWEEVEYFDAKSSQWLRMKRDLIFSDEMYLRFARCSNFDPEVALELMEQFDPHYLTLTCATLEKQLLSQTLFIPPGLQTNAGLDVFYMRPCRYFPRKAPTSEIIDNLIYVMNAMLEKEKSCTEGIAFMANMAGWKRENFSVSYCFEFMKALQGRIVPVRVGLFLIVDPPSWFGVIWDVMNQMLSKEFSKRVRMVRSYDLGKYLQPGYHQYLPDDMVGGKSRTREIISDFVAYRKLVEGCATTSTIDNTQMTLLSQFSL